MIWDLQLPMLLVFASWLVTGTWASLPVMLFSGVVLFSSSTVVSLLALISLHLVAFLQTAVHSKKTAIVLTQKAYFVRLLGCFLALFGVATQGESTSILWVFAGLILTLPLIPISVPFSRHYLSLTSRAFIDTVLIPALVTVFVLARIKSSVKEEFGVIWDLVLVLIGIATATVPAFFAGLSSRSRWTLIHISQSWIGIFIFVLVPELKEDLFVLLPAALGFGVLSVRLFESSAPLGSYPSAIARAILLCMPGSLGFLVMRQILPGIVGLNPLWLLWVLAIFVMHVYALVQSYQPNEALKTNPSVPLKWWLLLVVQIAVVVGLVS
jgi:hypothetical protein